ncbi:hypothetical protein [Cognatishimia sp.]|uniref:hypothetical protein n=1 Tax=Cognatishimia sp. TaxID=2211648 RepID=UPI003513B45B
MKSTSPIVTRLIALDTLKTWSLIATLFGDLDGVELSGTQIRDLLGDIGIKPEAIRVALHRLKSDGWIVATKQGRAAIYQMSPSAKAETQAVAPDIYRQRVKYPQGWAFEYSAEAPTSRNAIVLQKNLCVVPVSTASNDDNSLLLRPRTPDVPDWVAAQLVSGSLVDLAAGLARLLHQADHLRTPQEQTMYRLLVLHHWRRIALRDGSWAHVHFFPDGAIARCHAQVTAYLHRTDRIRLDG